MNDQVSLHATVYGHVQGVYFRNFVEQHATALGLTGYVRNLTSVEAVDIWAEGERSKIEELLKQLHTGPPFSKVKEVKTEWSEPTGKYKDFRIRHF